MPKIRHFILPAKKLFSKMRLLIENQIGGWHIKLSSHKKAIIPMTFINFATYCVIIIKLTI